MARALPKLKVDLPGPGQPSAAMLLAIPFPELSPELFAVEIGGIRFALRWYALAYIAGLLGGLWIVRQALRRPALWPGNTPPMSPAQADALLTWVVLGVVVGGRLGFVLFYRPGYYLQNPAEILAVWQGGMAFHGGLLGVVVAAAWFCWKERLAPMSVADAMALATPPGLLLGRIANFINGELWGRPTTVPWGVIFPDPRAQLCPPGWEGPCARHPSQLYEAGLEGLVLGALLVWMVFARGALQFPGRVVGTFLLGYGLARSFVELFRQGDWQYVTADNPWGYFVQFGDAGLTMGQILSLPMVAIGLALLAVSARRQPA